MARNYLDSNALPVVGIDTVITNISEKPRDQWDSAFVQTQIGILDRTSEQLISTGPATCDVLIEHHANLIDLVIILDGALQAELDGDYVVANTIIERAMTAIVKAGESLQTVTDLAEPAPESHVTTLSQTSVLRDGLELRPILLQRERVECNDESPGQYRCSFPLEGTTGDVMLIYTAAGSAADFTVLYLDLDKQVQFGEVERFYALMIAYTIADASTASTFSGWLADGLVSSLWDWEAAGTDAVAFETNLNGVDFRVSATTSILMYKACIGDQSFCAADD
jgi:hypothetical protein